MSVVSMCVKYQSALCLYTLAVRYLYAKYTIVCHGYLLQRAGELVERWTTSVFLLNSAAFNITGLSCVPSRLSSLSSSDIDSAQDIMAEQSHLRVGPGFGQYYFYQLDNAEYLITSPNTSYLPTPPPAN